MAKRRMRVCIGYKDDGSPVVTQVSADTELELSDKIVQTILKSARRSEFVQIAEQAAAEELPIIPTFKDYTEEWFQVYKAERIKRTTAGGYRSVIEGHFYPVWKDTLVDQISTKDIQVFLNKRKHLAEKSLKEMLTLLNSILESAKIDGHIEKNPASDKRLVIPSTKRQSARLCLWTRLRILSVHFIAWKNGTEGIWRSFCLPECAGERYWGCVGVIWIFRRM